MRMYVYICSCYLSNVTAKQWLFASAEMVPSRALFSATLHSITAISSNTSAQVKDSLHAGVISEALVAIPWDSGKRATDKLA